MRIRQNIVSTALGLLLLAGGIGAVHAADPILTTTPTCVTPTNDMAVEGRRAYMRMNCYSCHGSNGHNGIMGPSLVGKAGSVKGAVPAGRSGGMPSYKNKLCANDLANLSAYIQLLGTGTEPDFVNWWEPGPGLPSR
jgi:cytochrome c551